MPRLLQITELGHEIIHERAKGITNPRGLYIQELIDNIIFTCKNLKGVGLAAPQVGEPFRLLIISSRPNLWYPDAPNIKPMDMINPIITYRSKKIEMGWESCLSIPGIYGMVPRHRSVTVSFTDRCGNQKKTFLDGFAGRVFQHEYDHFNGIMFPDRTDRKCLVTRKNYQQIVREAAEKRKNEK